ncbi:hypothetical protein GCM10017752_20590 [Streptomyces roseoviridis]
MVVAAVLEDEPAEAESALAGIEGGEQSGLFGDEHVPLQAGLGAARAGRGEGGRDAGLGLVPEGVESGVELGDEFLLVPKFFG